MAENIRASVLPNAWTLTEAHPAMKTNEKRIRTAIALVVASMFMASFAFFGPDIFRKRHFEKPDSKDGPLSKEMERRNMSTAPILVKIGHRSVPVHSKASGSCGLSDAEIQSAVEAVSEWFVKLGWPDDEPIFLEEKEETLIVTFPVPPEMEPTRYRSDHTLRILLERKTKTVLRVSGG